MLKSAEKAALAHWWRYDGKAMVIGISTGIAIVGLPVALMIGFMTN